MGVWDRARDPEYLARMVSHPYRASVEQRLAALVAQLRATADRADLYDVQVALARSLFEAERQYGEVNAARKRRHEALDWDVEFWRRSIVQLRSIGDAVAWRFFDYRRQWLVLLGTNQQPGHMTGKAGTSGELEAWEAHWASGEPSILTALTNRLTVGDLLVDTGDGVVSLLEVKPNGKHASRSQRVRAETLVRQINETQRIDGPDHPTYIIESDRDLTSHWTEARPAVGRAQASGVSLWSPAPGLVVKFIAGPAAAQNGQTAFARSQEIEDRNLGVTWAPAALRITTDSTLFPYRGKSVVPIPLLPIDPVDCAAILTGALVFKTEFVVDALVDALQSQGFYASVALDGDPTTLADGQPIVRWRKGRDSGTVNASAVNQIGIELQPFALVAAALSERARRGPERRAHRFVCFRNEAAVWA